MSRWSAWSSATLALVARPGLRWPDLVVAGALVAAAWAGWEADRGALPMLSFGPDTSNWIEAAIALRNHDLPGLANTGRPLTYPLILAAGLAPGVDVVARGMWVSVGAWVALPAVGYLAGTALAGRVAGALAAWLLLGSAPLAEPAVMVNSQALFNVALCAWIGAALPRMARAGARDALLLGLGGGLLLLTKEQGLLVSAFTGVALVGVGAVRAARAAWAGRSWRVGGRGAAGVVGLSLVFVVGFGVALSPQVALTWVEYAELQRLPKLLLPLSDFLTSHHLQNPLASLPGAGTPPSETIRGGTADKAIGGNAAMALYTSLGALPTLASIGLGLGLARRRTRAAAAWTALHLAPLGPALALGFFYPYHVSFLVVPLALLTGIGAVALVPTAEELRAGDRRGARIAQGVLALAVLVGLAGGARAQVAEQAKARGYRLARAYDAAKIQQWSAAVAWVRANVPPGARLLSVEPSIARACGAVPVDSSLTPMSPSAHGPPPRPEPCDLYVVYDAKELNQLWFQHAVEPPDYLPERAEALYAGDGPPLAAARVAVWRGATPDAPACVPKDVAGTGFPQPLLAPPDVAPPSGHGPPRQGPPPPRAPAR